MVLTGPDPSAKKSDKDFGLDLGSELDLRATLLPPDLPEGVSKGLANAMVDVISIPGGFSGGTDESEGNEMALLGEAMEELVSQGRNQNEGAAKADLHWRSSKRTALRQVKGAGMLRKRIKVLLKLRDRVIKHTIIAVRNACKRGGWQDTERIEAWAHGGYITRITRDGLDYNLSLHNHLMGLLSGGAPWHYVKTELTLTRIFITSRNQVRPHHSGRCGNCLHHHYVWPPPRQVGPPRTVLQARPHRKIVFYSNHSDLDKPSF
jgi:hypothetical protein